MIEAKYSNLPYHQHPDVYDNAKIEQILCASIKPVYDGSPYESIPTLNATHIRHQNEVWNSVTFIIQDAAESDLIRHSSKATYDVILTQAKNLWDNPNSITQCHIRGTQTYNAQLCWPCFS